MGHFFILLASAPYRLGFFVLRLWIQVADSLVLGLVEHGRSSKTDGMCFMCLGVGI